MDKSIHITEKTHAAHDLGAHAENTCVHVFRAFHQAGVGFDEDRENMVHRLENRFIEKFGRKRGKGGHVREVGATDIAEFTPKWEG
jgi:hypothetical protein